MLEPKDIAAKSLAIRRQLEVKLGVKSRDLEQALRRTGRRLPRGIRAQGAVLTEAEHLVGHPRIARQLDPEAVQKAYADLMTHLRAIDVADIRKGRILGVAGLIAANLLLVVAAFITWMWWRGYV